MTSDKKIKELEDEIKLLQSKNSFLEQSLNINKNQLELNDRHLHIILANSTFALSAFSKAGVMELNIGKGLDVPLTNANAYKSAFLGYSLDQLEQIMPHVIEAVRVCFEKRIKTYAQTLTPSGKIFYVTLVPFINKKDEVEYVYSLALRIPELEEIDQEHFYKGQLILPPLN